MQEASRKQSEKICVTVISPKKRGTEAIFENFSKLTKEIAIPLQVL